MDLGKVLWAEHEVEQFMQQGLFLARNADTVSVNDTMASEKFASFVAYSCNKEHASIPLQKSWHLYTKHQSACWIHTGQNLNKLDMDVFNRGKHWYRAKRNTQQPAETGMKSIWTQVC